MRVFWIVLLTLAIPVLVLQLFRLWRTWRETHGKRLVSCPETHMPEAVEIDTKAALRSTLTGRPKTQLKACTRWHERAGCGQECLEQIETSPEGCRVLSLLEGWYRGKSCVLCGRAFGMIRWYDHKPGLVNADRKMFSWDELEAKELDEIFAKYYPLCWDCHTTERFIEQNPEKVVFRPDRITHKD